MREPRKTSARTGRRRGAAATGGAALAAAGLLITAIPAAHAADATRHRDPQAAAAHAAGAGPADGPSARPTGPGGTTPPAAGTDIIPLPETDTPPLVDGLHDPVDAKAAPADAARAHLAAQRGRYRIPEPHRDLAPTQTLRHGDDETVRLQQKHRGVPVLGGQYVVRMETGKGRRTVTGTSGKYFTGLTVGTEPAVSEETAVRRAVTATLTRLSGDRLTRPARNGAGAGDDARRGTRAENRALRGASAGLVVVPRGEGVLTYHVTVRGTHPVSGEPVLQHVYVDARAGYPVLQYSGIKTLAPTTGSTPGTSTSTPAARTGTSTPAARARDGAPARGTAPAAPGTPVTGSGVRLDGGKVPLAVHRPAPDGPYVLSDHTRMAATTGNTLTTWDARDKDVFDVLGTWPDDLKPFTSATPDFGQDATDSGAVDAHWAAAQVFDYYKERHGRTGLDGRGSAVNSLVGVTAFGAPFVNAFWDGTKMVYGSGDEEFRPLSADLDVVGHEMTHGVVENTANLVYAGQSGALNEAVADYFGNAIDVDRSGRGMDDPDAGLIGEDLCRTAAPRDCALRDLDDGATTAKDFLGVTFGVDNGGVHLNSTIFSGALWDLRQDLGPELADRIVYKALSEYLTPLDGFTEGREAVVAAARALGATARQVDTVKRSFNAHGIVRGWENALGADSDTLLRKVNTDGTDVQAGGGWWTAATSNDDGSEPYSVYAGRIDGKGAPKLMSPNDGRFHVNPATDGRTVVWVAYGAENVEILSRPLAGGPVKRLLGTQADVLGVRVDRGVTVFDLYDLFGDGRHVGVLRPGDPRPAYVDGARPDTLTGLPSIGHGRVAYAKLYPAGDTDGGADGDRLGVEILDLATGKAVLAEQHGEPQSVGRTGVNATHVFWLNDENLDDEGQTTIRRTGHDGTGTYDISSEYKPGALVATELTVSDTAVTVNGTLPGTGDGTGGPGGLANADLPKVWQLATDGSRVQRMSCDRGMQVSPVADSGTRVVWLDGTSGWTNLVTRARPAGKCG
ncbi:M4 family metallopeptidase [Streptomyces sp. enrichment culture]|uniref:M4 family metallopeptidase n=1 Tax=Streptomyces sp. enrichment culture TaxID=1795815 RepID=UPI003F549CAB